MNRSNETKLAADGDLDDFMGGMPTDKIAPKKRTKNKKIKKGKVRK